MPQPSHRSSLAKRLLAKALLTRNLSRCHEQKIEPIFGKKVEKLQHLKKELKKIHFQQKKRKSLRKHFCAICLSLVLEFELGVLGSGCPSHRTAVRSRRSAPARRASPRARTKSARRTTTRPWLRRRCRAAGTRSRCRTVRASASRSPRAASAPRSRVVGASGAAQQSRTAEASWQEAT